MATAVSFPAAPHLIMLLTKFRSHISTMLSLGPQSLLLLPKAYRWQCSRRDITDDGDNLTGWKRPSMRRSWQLLELTSTTFASVIKQLHGDLGRVICLYYLALRALDTIEDDMTLDLEFKNKMLPSFYECLSREGWKFEGSDPMAKDRDLLVEFDVVVQEFITLPEEYREVIMATCREMGEGMAIFCQRAATSITVDTSSDLDDYCHIVAGVVGQGLTQLFALSGLESQWLKDQGTIANSWGLFLQKVNILRDYREDSDESRCFWPRQMWLDQGFTDARELQDASRQESALWVLSEMALQVLGHAVDVLEYISFLRNPTVFEFVAIPAVMAMATLQECFMNPEVFQRNIKPSKGDCYRIILSLESSQDVAAVFASCAKDIRLRTLSSDPHHAQLVSATLQVERWYDERRPSFSEKLYSLWRGSVSRQSIEEKREGVVN